MFILTFIASSSIPLPPLPSHLYGVQCHLCGTLGQIKDHSGGILPNAPNFYVSNSKKGSPNSYLCRQLLVRICIPRNGTKI